MARTCFLLLTLFAATPALAQDVMYEEPLSPPLMPIEMPAPPPWTSLYVGAHAGAAFYNEGSEFEDRTGRFGGAGLVGETEGGDAGVAAGLHVGYDQQIGSLIIGAVADVNYVDTSVGARFALPTNVPGSIADFGAQQEIDWLTTARAKVGFATDRFALYATGGLAYAGISNTTSGPQTFINPAGTTFAVEAEDDAGGLGYAGGAGVDYMVTEGLSIGVEYLYHNLGSADATFGFRQVGGDTGLDFETSSSDDIDFHTIRAKASFRFN